MTLEEQAHFRILKAFQENHNLTQHRSAENSGISLDKINFRIDALMEKGAIMMYTFRRLDIKHKKIAYILTPTDISYRFRLAHGYLEREKAEFEALKAEIDALELESQNKVPNGAQRGKA